MYNEVVKQMYINRTENEKSIIALTNLFNRMETNIEIPLGRDLATIGNEKLKISLEEMGYLSYSTIRTEVGLLRDYINWYDNNVAPVEKLDLLARDIDISEGIRRNIFKDEDELKASLSYLPVAEGYFEVPVLLLSWIGMELNDILNLKNEDLMFKEYGVFINTPKSVIDVKSEYIKNSLFEYSKVKTSTRKHRGIWIVNMDDLGYFIKNMVPANSRLCGKRLTPDTIRRKLFILNNMLPSNLKQVTITNVLLSGKLWRIKQEEDLIGKITEEIFLKEFKTKYGMIINDMMEVYKYYKKVFFE